MERTVEPCIRCGEDTPAPHEATKLTSINTATYCKAKTLGGLAESPPAVGTAINTVYEDFARVRHFGVSHFGAASPEVKPLLALVQPINPIMWGSAQNEERQKRPSHFSHWMSPGQRKIFPRSPFFFCGLGGRFMASICNTSSARGGEGPQAFGPCWEVQELQVPVASS